MGLPVWVMACALGMVCLWTGSAAGYEFTDETLPHNGLIRTYTLFVPDDLPAGPVALVVTLHGGEEDADYANFFHYEGRWMELAQLNKFIVVFPEGRPDPSGDGGHHWNDCRGAMHAPEAESFADDVGFIDALIDTLSARYAIDPQRVYTNGYSNGGIMAFRLADQLRDRFAAVATAVASLPVDSECPDTAMPIPVMMMNGTADPLLPFNGGIIGEGNGRGAVIPTWDTVRYWAYVNGIEGAPSAKLLPDKATDDGSRVTLYTYSGGLNGSEVLFYLVDGGGHTVPGNTAIADLEVAAMLGVKNRDIVGADEMWHFFSRHTLAPVPGNRAPLAVDDGPMVVAKDGPGAAHDLLANDTDPDGDALALAAVIQPANGTVAIGADGRTAVYAPDAGFAGTDFFDYRVTDGQGGIATARVTVAVRKNTAPVATDLTLSSSKGKPVSFTLAGTDADGDKVTIAVRNTPSKGVLAGSMPNFTYYPNQGFSGTDSFEFVVYDPFGEMDTGVVRFNVTANAAPVPTSLTLSSDRGQPVSFTLAGTDADGDRVNLAVKSVPANGVLTGTVPNFTYYPKSGFSGTDRFEFVAYDDLGGIGIGSVTIEVTANRAPVAQSPTVYTWMGLPVNTTLSATDADGDAVSYGVSKLPQHGVLGGSYPNLMYYPQAGFVGTDSFEYKAWDAFGGISTGTVTIVVRQPAAISLTGIGQKVDGVLTTELSWTGINSATVNIYRNGVLIGTPSNTGTYRDPVNTKGTWKYIVLEVGSGRLSNDVTIKF